MKMHGCYRVCDIRIPKETFDMVLGNPDWEWVTIDTESVDPCDCGKRGGVLDTAGWYYGRGCVRVYIHEDGFCIRPGMVGADVDETARDKVAELLENL